MRASVGGWLLKSDIEPAAGERLDDEHVRRRRVASSGTRFETASILRSASASPYGLPGDRRAAGVGGELARPRDRHLDQHRRERRQDHHRQQRDRIVPRSRSSRPP